jgi:hypothetical protein
VISTSTHGGDISVPPFPEMVMAMHLVTIDGREVWVERASQPITDDVPLAMALACKDAEIVRNDALFNSMLVGFGRFGVVYSYVLRVQPRRFAWQNGRARYRCHRLRRSCGPVSPAGNSWGRCLMFFRLRQPRSER